MYKVFTDGGSRGNPGQAAYGFVIYDPKGELVAKESQCIGVTTNNQAEYQGIVAALEKLVELKIHDMVVCSLDSELVVRQINGIYKMKNADLKPWLGKVHDLVKQLGDVQFVHVRREQNKEADKLVNEALDNEVTHGA